MTYTRSECPSLTGDILHWLQKHLRTRFARFRCGTAGERGQAMVEFAVLLLPMLTLIVGIVKCGIMFNNYVTLTNAVAYSARTLAVSQGDGTGPPTACAAATTALDNAAANLNTSQITMAPVSFPSPDTSTCTNMVAGDTATVQATYPCDLQILFLNVWPTCTLTARTTVVIE
jgi:Flp pilus assembly protein TadG